jgi:hypothetical protein
MGARGPSITEVAGEPLGGQIFNVFTLRDARIVRIDVWVPKIRFCLQSTLFREEGQGRPPGTPTARFLSPCLLSDDFVDRHDHVNGPFSPGFSIRGSRAL